MPSKVSFVRTFATYGPDINSIEKSAPIADLISGIINRWHYPFDAFIGARITSEWLSDSRLYAQDRDDMDLIFDLRGQDYQEVILRDHDSMPVYGGWLIRGVDLEITDDIKNGHRVLVSTLADGGKIRHQFTKGLGFVPVVGTTPIPRSAQSRFNLLDVAQSWHCEA